MNDGRVMYPKHVTLVGNLADWLLGLAFGAVATSPPILSLYTYSRTHPVPYPCSTRPIRLGHADISTTLNIYAQANTKKKEEVMEQMGQLMLTGGNPSSE